MVFGLINCKEEVVSDVTPLPLERNLVGTTLLYEVSMDDLQNLARAFGKGDLVEKITHGISAYKIVYETTYKENKINASGVMYIPTNLTAPAPILSLHHGTSFVKNDVPSASGSFSGMEYFAAGGYITFMPDFIGYGESAGVFHPYYDQKHSALAVIDIIKAGKNFLTDNEILYNEQVFLAGYSEGGYVTMAAAKELELHPEHNINVTAIAAGAGGYDLSEMLELIKTNDTYPYPAYLAFVIMSYNETNGWNLPLTYFFQEKYASALPGLLDGSKNGDQINSQLTTNLNNLFNTEFYERLKNNGELDFQEALIKNSIGLDNWVPEAPTRLFHGTADKIVPYANSQKVFKNLLDIGAEDIELIKIEGSTHGSSIIPMIQSLVPWFDSLINKES
ncbi:MAG: lipase family protein [Bacteroidota bacterium]|nr:lipase family protein [Bacteroidota bacterium]